VIDSDETRHGNQATRHGGRRILYTHGPDEAHQVYVMDADGSAKTNPSRNRNDEWATSWR
jgi:Tol biopolymer transport system component